MCTTCILCLKKCRSYAWLHTRRVITSTSRHQITSLGLQGQQLQVGSQSNSKHKTGWDKGIHSTSLCMRERTQLIDHLSQSLLAVIRQWARMILPIYEQVLWIYQCNVLTVILLVSIYCINCLTSRKDETISETFPSILHFQFVWHREAMQVKDTD